MMAVSEQVGVWLEEFSKLVSPEPWLKALRERAFARFAETGFPTTHDEEWRFTNVAAIARDHFPVGGVDVRLACSRPVQALAYPPSHETLAAAEPHLGRYAGIDVNPFTALNTAFLASITMVIVPAGAVVEQPI